METSEISTDKTLDCSIKNTDNSVQIDEIDEILLDITSDSSIKNNKNNSNTDTSLAIETLKRQLREAENKLDIANKLICKSDKIRRI
ncbi:hypothetical protein X777_03229 [Ooceraea biroi]|nr:hypothetical protein X777_03229 [Ooceraea biroi]